MEPKVLKAALYGNNNDESTWDVEQKTKYQENTVLHVAATSGNKKTAEKILETQPLLVLHPNKNLDTPLHIAARLGYVDVSSLLISHTITYAQNTERGIRNPFRKVNLSKNTALHEAVRFGHHSIVKLLIEQDRELTSLTNEAGESPLFLALDRKFHTIALYILDTCPDSASCFQGRNGMTAMHAAVIGMPPQRNIFVEKLHKFITDLFQPCLNARLSFSFAILRTFKIDLIVQDGLAIIRQKDVLGRLMVRCGSEILKKQDDLGWLPLHYAAHMGNVQVIKLFLTNIDFAYEKVGDKEGMSSLHIATRQGLKGHIGVIRALVKECPDVCESLDNRDRTALHVAVESGNRNVVKTMLNMLEFNDLINEQDKDGNTCLHLAAFHVRHPAILIMLATDRRVETAILNKMGLTAVDIISSNTHLNRVDKAFMISMLKKEGYMPSLERRIVVRETTSVDRNIEGHEGSQETKQRLKMPVAEGSGATNTGRENNKEKHLVTPNCDIGNNKSYEHIRNIATINLLVATIIASITFAAAMQMPGGYDSKGIANLRRNLAFKIFVMADSVAFGCAAASMFIHFAVALCSKLLQETHSYPINCVMLLTIISIASSVLAFIMGANMVFTGSSHGGLHAGLPVYVASLSFLIPILYFFLHLIKVGLLLMPSFYIFFYNFGMSIERAIDQYYFLQLLAAVISPFLNLWLQFFRFPRVALSGSIN